MKLLALIKKEFHRFFHDPRLIVTILLPGLFVFLLYNLLGEVISDQVQTSDAHYNVYVSGESVTVSQIKAVLEQGGSTVTLLEVASFEEAISAVEGGEATAYLVFSEGFDAFPAGASAEIYYSPDAAGEAFYAVSSAVLQSFGMRFALVPHGFATEETIGRTVMQSILPLLVVTFIFSACMSVTLESVAGEKERGTLATILATSVKRSHIALGKILPLSCIASLGAASSFFGVILSMPKLMGISLSALVVNYGFVSYLLLFLAIVGIVPLIVSLISVVSAFSKSVKEASAYTSIVMVLMIVVSLLSAFVMTVGDWAVAVPVLNVVMVMQEILAGGMPVLNVLLCFGANLLYTALLVLLIAKMLSSERVMFGK